MSTTDLIREEYGHLLAGIEAIRHAGDIIGDVPHDVAREATERSIEFLQGRLIPHAHKEEEHLYPRVAQSLGSLRATRTMSRDHAEVISLTNQLVRAVEEGDEPMMRRLLYGLYHVIRLHFAKEAEIYLPLVGELLSCKESEEVYRRMHAA